MRINCKQTKKFTDMKTYIDGQKKRKNLKNQQSLVNAGPPDRVSVLSIKCGGRHSKGLIVARSYKIKQTIII